MSTPVPTVPPHPLRTPLIPFPAENTAQTPPCIFTPRKPAEAALGLKLLSKNNAQFAIRSGGHSMNANFSSTSTGVLMHTTHFTEITINKLQGTAKIGTGNTWSRVYQTVEKEGYAVAGGRSEMVGVGGFALGGGLSFYLYETGFSCNTIVQYDVITAAGKILNVTEVSHPELFVALKGSGAPFVLVTSITMKMFPLSDGVDGKIWGGLTFSGSTSVPGVLEALAEFTTGTLDLNTHLITSVSLGSNATKVGKSCFNIVFHRDALDAVPTAFTKIVAAADKELVLSVLGKRSISALSTLTEDLILAGLTRQYMLPFTIINPTVSVLKELERIFVEVFTPLFGAAYVEQAIINFILIGSHAPTVGNNVLGLDQSGKTNYLSGHFYVTWHNESEDAIVRGAGREAYARTVT